MILIVDDDLSVRMSLGLLLKQAGYPNTAADSPAQALEMLREPNVQLVLCDMNFSRQTSGEEGLQLLQDIKALRPELPVILITAWGSIALAVNGMRLGAAEFLTKPWTHESVLNAVRCTLELQGARNGDKSRSRQELDQRYQFGDLIGQDPAFLELLDLAGRVAKTDASVLITGESGTGKELMAAAIHANSRRHKGPFVKVNLGGMSHGLFESEMFGHTKGAFTDAKHNRTGRFEAAQGGTIFLDEIGDLDPQCQVKLLRVLQDRTFEPLGSSTSKTVDLRVISATNQPLTDLVAEGTFREDLLYRINLITLELPPLRKRPEDIPLLAQHFMVRLAKAYNRPDLHLETNALNWLKRQPFPGNIRQLKQVVERAVLISAEDQLGVEAFQQHQIRASKNTLELPEVGSMTLAEVERAMIVKAMSFHKGNISKVAEDLGLSRAALYRRLEKFDIAT